MPAVFLLQTICTSSVQHSLNSFPWMRVVVSAQPHSQHPPLFLSVGVGLCGGSSLPVWLFPKYFQDLSFLGAGRSCRACCWSAELGHHPCCPGCPVVNPHVLLHAPQQRCLTDADSWWGSCLSFILPVSEPLLEKFARMKFPGQGGQGEGQEKSSSPCDILTCFHLFWWIFLSPFGLFLSSPVCSWFVVSPQHNLSRLCVYLQLCDTFWLPPWFLWLFAEP